MKTVKVHMDDIWIHTKGKEPKNNSPVLDYCRKLLAEGYPYSTKLEVYRNNDEPDIICPKIGKSAKWAIKENKRYGPTFRKHRPFPSSLKGQGTVTRTTTDAFKSEIGMDVAK